MNQLRPQSLYLPSDTPLQKFVERSHLDDLSILVRGEKEKKKTKAKHNRDGKSNATTKTTTVTTKRDGLLTVNNDTKGSLLPMSADPNEKPEDADHSKRLHHTLGRLYHTICRQDADDYSQYREMSDGWTVDSVRAKLRSFEAQISALDKREEQIVNESKRLGHTTSGVMHEAYTLLGMAPPYDRSTVQE